MAKYGSENGKEVWKQLENIQRFGYSPSLIFSDWIDLALNSLLSLTVNVGRPDFKERLSQNNFDDQYNARYMEVVKKYKENRSRARDERPIDYFTAAWGMTIQQTQSKKQDILGQIFTEQITHGENGQFFTPSNVTDMMAQMIVGDKKDGETVLDPCCGSGRFLISAARQNPNCVFHGNDLDIRCARMTALNMWLFDLEARVTCGNALSGTWHVGWKIRRGGFIYEVENNVPKETSQPVPEQSMSATSKPANEPRTQLDLNL